MLAFAFGVCRPAAAQATSDPGFGIGGHAAYTRSRGADSGSLSGGVQARARLTGGIGVEALVSYRRQEYAAAGAAVLRVEEIPVQGSLQLFFLYQTPVQPYVLAGGGYYYVRSRGLGTNPAPRVAESKFGFHAGAGVDVRVGRKVSLYADVRYVLLDVGAVEDLKTLYGLSASASYVHATAGLTFYF